MNHLQHNMGSQSFKAQMAIGSWLSTPLLPDIDQVTKIISDRLQRKPKVAGKGKEKAMDVDADGDHIMVDSD